MFDLREASSLHYQYGRQTLDGRVGSQGMTGARPSWIVRVNFSFPVGSVEGEPMYMHSQEDVRVQARNADEAREFAEAETHRQRATVATAVWVARIEYERQW